MKWNVHLSPVKPIPSNQQNVPLLFVHGWAMGPWIWDPLLPLLPAMQVNRVDLGFFGSPEIPALDNPLVITHSLGLLWSMMHIPRPWRGLVCINSFTRFVATEDFSGVNPHWLRRMKNRLQQDPVGVVADFLRRCDPSQPSALATSSAQPQWSARPSSALQAPHLLEALPPTADWNRARLLQGLEWLEQWDLRAPFARMDCPVLAICGATDLIVRSAHSRVCFSEVPLIMVQNAGHLIPLTHAQWLAEKIMGATAAGQRP